MLVVLRVKEIPSDSSEGILFLPISALFTLKQRKTSPVFNNLIIHTEKNNNTVRFAITPAQ
jgi:hypothetical protein